MHALPRTWLLLGIVVAGACGPVPEGPLPDGSVPPPPPDAEIVIDAMPPPEPDATVFDCDAIPDEPLSVQELGPPRGYHDVAFDDLGHIIGSDGSALLKVTSAGATSILTPLLPYVEQMDYLPDGDLVVADSSTSTLRRVRPDGTDTVISADVYAYGVTVGPDGMIYAAGGSQLLKVDPTTGEKQILVDAGSSGWTPKVVNFSPDFTKMYVGTLGEGAIYVIDLDASYEPIGEPQLFATGVGQGWHDSLGVDVCGNLYVAEYWTSTLQRVSPTGQVHLLKQWQQSEYGHGLEWGSGIDGWNADAIYLPQPYNGNTVVEVVLGVPRAPRMPSP
jgi:hypothetical protein